MLQETKHLEIILLGLKIRDEILVQSKYTQGEKKN